MYDIEMIDKLCQEYKVKIASQNKAIAVSALTLDERASGVGEWGYRPADSSVSMISPPSFSWRPMENMKWEIECSRDSAFSDPVYRAENIAFNVNTPDKTFATGSYYWRYRGKDENGAYTDWSSTRQFTIADNASLMPLPARVELLSRIPRRHPRLFVRPEEIANLKNWELRTSKISLTGLSHNAKISLRIPPISKNRHSIPRILSG